MATSTTDSATEGLSVYVDEQIGSDETGDGSIQKPYHSAAQAIVNHGPSPPLNILTRKTETDEWAPIGISALKKARKGAEGIEKKKQKALEAEAKAAEKAAEKGKVKDLVLEEDASLPAAVRVRLIYLRWVARLTCPTDKDQIP
jgi:asparaginyl-tRNA synthetase